MNVNKKLDRFKQWAGERMGGEVKTNVSDNFKALETEMNVRHDGMERIQKSMTAYVKAISKRSEGDDKEKTLPVAHLGSSMVSHGEDFDANSDFGQALLMFGKSQERIARVQEGYISQSSSTWLEALERSLAQMKDYYSSRRKLESRRLAYDTSLSKMQKAKKEDFRVEEELRTQKVKYEEANEDVYRRMQDIKDSETENLADLTAFLEAQLTYHERCCEVLMQLKNEWPSGSAPSQSTGSRRTGRPRSNTAHSYHERYEPLHEEPPAQVVEPRPIIRSRQPSAHPAESPARDSYQGDSPMRRPSFNRAPTFEGPTQLRQEQASASPTWHRSTSDTFPVRRSQSQARPISRVDPYLDSSEDVGSYGRISPDRSYGEGSASPSSSHILSRASSATALRASSGLAKKGPPPPPPSRAKKPPPPPPMKRSLIGAGDA